MSDSPTGQAVRCAHPSLALIKYWGKTASGVNIPATPSLAVTLDGLYTETRAEIRPARRGEQDRVFIDDSVQPPERFAAFFAAFRALTPVMADFRVTVYSRSNFPFAAGLASSASGFAALACACCAAAGLELRAGQLSALARIGSASAARSVFGGFVRLDAGAECAAPVYGKNWWPQLRIVILETQQSPKSISSRNAMELTRQTSPFFDSWVSDAPNLMQRALLALKDCCLDELGPLVRGSYMRMFATMFGAFPPVVYWNPASLNIIHLCTEMRAEGLSVWETMDAGPQVKLICLDDQLPQILSVLNDRIPEILPRVCSAGGAPWNPEAG